MFVLFLAVALILFGFGFLNPLWWMAVAVLVFRSHPLRPRSRRSRDRSLPDVAVAVVAAWEGEPLPRLMQRAATRTCCPPMEGTAAL